MKFPNLQSTYLSLLNGTPNAEGWAGLVLCILGVIFLIGAIFPGCYEVYKTQNTVYVPIQVYYILTAMCCCFALGAEFWLIESVQDIGGSGNEYGLLTAQAALFLVMNIINGSGNLYVLLLKKENDAEAKKLGISLEEHYQRYCLPKIQSKSK